MQIEVTSLFFLPSLQFERLCFLNRFRRPLADRGRLQPFRLQGPLARLGGGAPGGLPSAAPAGAEAERWSRALGEGRGLRGPVTGAGTCGAAVETPHNGCSF